METRFVQTENGKLAYTDYGGPGALVLMIPGMGALRSEYRFLAPVLLDVGFHPVSVDLRGHGESTAIWPDYGVASVGRDIIAVIEALGTGPAHVIGTSFSPGAMVWAAVERPDLFQSLVLIGAFVRDPKTSFLQKLMMAVLFGGPWKYGAWRSFYGQMYPSQQPADFGEYLNALEASLREPGRFDALVAIADTPRTESKARLPAVQAPALVVMGTKDPDWPDPVAEANWIADQLHTKPVLIEGAGHYPQTEAPDQTNPHIVSFLQSVVQKNQEFPACPTQP